MNRRIYKLLLFCMVSMLSVFVHAANSLQVTYQIGDAAAVTSEVSTEGNLVTLLGDNAMKVTQLSVNGYLNNEDIGLLKKMAGQTKETDSEVTGSLKSLNLSEATFTETGKIVPESIFQKRARSNKLAYGVLPSRIISIAARTFQGCGITKLTLPTNEKLTGITRKLDFNGVQTDNMGALGYGAFFGCSKLTDLTIPANVTVINEVVFRTAT